MMHFVKFCRTAITPVLIFACIHSARAEQDKIAPCREDAMIVFDASGSMSGNQTLGVPNSQARIDVLRSALAQVLPSATRLRKVGLITFGPGPWNQCNVKVNLKPTANAGAIIMREVYALVPAGKTPLTSAVEQAAQALDYRNKPGVVVVVTDGEETCGRSPCDLAKQLQDAARQLTIHVISFRYQSYSWTGEQSIEETKCLAKQNGGLFITVDTEQDLTAALEKTLDCPMISQQVP
jgi:Ca-activated chloride channel family protein